MKISRVLYAALTILAVAPFVAGAAETRGTSKGNESAKVKLAPLPNVRAGGGGDAEFTLAEDGSTLHYVLRVNGVKDATMGHIHEVTARGTPGAIIAWLYPTTGEAPSLKAGTTTGILAEGDIGAAKLGGPLKGGTAKELLEKIKGGKAGIAVHTKENPGGELWGIHRAESHSMSRGHSKKTM